MTESDHQQPSPTVFSGFGSKAINFVLFQLVWFVTVLGAARGLTWPGVVALILFAALHARLTPEPRKDFQLLGAAMVIGLLFDSALVRSGLLEVAADWPSRGLAPLWMLILWANLALAINHCLAWIHGRYWLAAGFGAIGGPLAYIGGAALGAGSFTVPGIAMPVALGLFWAGVTPLLFWIAAGLAHKKARPSQG